jgi:hypothetical protein
MLELLLLGGLAAGVFAGNKYAKERDKEARGEFPSDGVGMAYLLVGLLWPITSIFLANRLPFRWIGCFVAAGLGFWVIAFEIYLKDQWGWYVALGLLTAAGTAWLNIMPSRRT